MALRHRRLVSALSLSALLAASFVAASPSTSGAATGDGTLDILVLGDSYSAGNGATDDAGQAQTYGPVGCYRSKVNWAEKYASKLRDQGVKVRVSNHACSGGVTADFTHPKVVETKANQTAPNVTTQGQADAYFATNPCNNPAVSDEESWSYHADQITPVGMLYTCTGSVKPQVDYVTPDVDLVLFTMGGNDAGFSSIVQNCFVPLLRSASGCQGKVDAARAALPTIRQDLIAGIGAIRSHGLRSDAKIVQLGYPWLQTDNNFTLPDPTPSDPMHSYPAGAQVRALVTDGDAAIATVVPAVNASNAGQMSFVEGVPDAFKGHEPDATTPVGNVDRWINQVADGADTSLWYHPNGLGQTAYAALLATHGTFNAPLDPPDKTDVSAPGGPATGLPVAAGASVKVRAPHGIRVGQRVRLRVKVRLVDGSRPRGKVTILGLPSGSKIAGKKVKPRNHGVVRIWVTVRSSSTTSVRVVYVDRSGATGSKDKAVRAAR